MFRRGRCGRATSVRLAATILLLCFSVATDAAPRKASGPSGYAHRPEVRAFIAELVAESGFDARELRRLFAQARYQPQVIAAISRPVLSPPKWYEYAPRFLEPARVDAGVEFWREHRDVLA